MIFKLILCILFIPTNLFALEDMDSIIDQLERDLIEQEKQLLNITKEEKREKR